MKYPAAQLVGLLATALGILSMQCKSTRALLRYQMSGNLLFVLHYWMLGAYTACVGQAILALNFWMLCRGHSPKARWKGWKWFFSILAFASGICTWQDGFSILPCAVSLASVLAAWSMDGTVIRRCKVWFCHPGWILYDLHAGSYSGILCEMIAMGSALLALFRYRKRDSQ